MTRLDTGTIPPITGPQSGPVGTNAATQVESGNILELIEEVDAQDAENFPIWRQNHALRKPRIEDEGTDLSGSGDDLIPEAEMFSRVRLPFTYLKGYATYEEEALSDHAAIGMAQFNEMISVPVRNMVSEEIVNPGDDTAWLTEGFARSPSITIPVVDAGDDVVVFDEPGVHVSRAMTKMCMAYGGQSDLVCSPYLCGAIRTARSTDGARGVGFQDLMLRRVVEQAFGFGTDGGDLLGIVGNFNAATVQVAWRERPHAVHHATGTQMLQWRSTARVGARYTLAVISPVAFVRLIAG